MLYSLYDPYQSFYEFIFYEMMWEVIVCSLITVVGSEAKGSIDILKTVAS